MKSKLLAIITVIIIFASMQLVMPSKAYACSCMGGPHTASEAFNNSDAVFYGKVIDTEDEAIQGGQDNVPFTARIFLFEVMSTWKGNIQGQIAVHTGKGGGDCGTDSVWVSGL
ncbi:MAG: hypothetical protein ACJ78Q_03445 [Chloroflexia bacterium]